MKHCGSIKTSTPFDPAIDDLMHPAGLFAHPQDVVDDRDLTLSEKRAILSSWASDACAVEAAPALRRALESGRTVTVDEIFDALCALDRLARSRPSSPRLRRGGAFPWRMAGVARNQPSLN